MGKVIIGFTMPLDGFLNDQNGSVERLYPYPLDTLRYAKSLQAIGKTGAVVLGRKTFAKSDPDSTCVNL